MGGIHSGPVCDHRYVLPPAGYNQYVKSAKILILLCLALGLACTGCNKSLISSRATAGLQNTAADYYNFRLGNLDGREYSSFLSPAYRGSFSKDKLTELNAGNAPARSANNRVLVIKEAQQLGFDPVSIGEVERR